MNEQDTAMDALDTRLAAYLHGRAEMASALGPGPDQVATAIATGAGWGVRAGRGAGAGLRGVPAFAWALLALGLLLVMTIALAAGAGREDRLGVLPPARAEESRLRGLWMLDFEASGIDNTYGGPTNPQPVVPEFGSLVWFGPGGELRVWTGGGGGCRTDGTWEAGPGRVAIAVPTGQNGCELVGPGPEARVIRERLAEAATYELDGDALTFIAADGRRLLSYVRDETSDPQMLWGSGELAPVVIEGAWWLDFDASGIDDAYGGRAIPGNGLRILSGVSFAPDGRFRVATGAGGGCETTGSWRMDGDALTVDLPTAGDGCEESGPGPSAREIRLRLARTERASRDASRLTLFDGAGSVLLAFDRSTDGSLWGPTGEQLDGRWVLDFEASGVDGTYISNAGPKRVTSELFSAIELGDGVVSGGTSRGGAGCDHFEGTYTDVGGRVTIDVPVIESRCDFYPSDSDVEVRRRLGRTVAWEVDGDVLRLLGADGAPLLVYRRAEAVAP